MPSVKIAITLEEETLRQVDSLVARRMFQNRSRAIQTALHEKIERMEGSRLAAERANHNPVRGHEQSGHRPVLILSHDIFNARSGTVIAVALTSQPQKAGFPLTLELKLAELRKPTWVKISQLRTLSVERIGKRLARIGPIEVTKVIEGLNEILGE